MTDEELDRINRAEEIQRYTENRCEALEQEKCELLGIIQGKDNVIKDLEWQLQEMVEDNDYYQEENEKYEKENEVLKNRNVVLKNRNVELKAQTEQLQRINNEQKEILKKVRVALIQERTANIMNYGKGGVEMFDDMFEILKGVSN